MSKGVGYTWSGHHRLENPVLGGLKCSESSSFDGERTSLIGSFTGLRSVESNRCARSKTPGFPYLGPLEEDLVKYQRVCGHV